MKPALLLTVLLALETARGASWPKVGPNYEPPKVTVPDSYHQQASAAGTNTEAAAGAWWTTLGDPELTMLIDRAAQANLDLKIAASRVLEARAARRVTRADLLPSVESRNSIQRARGGLTAGLFNVNADAGLGTQLDVERQSAQLESTRALVPALEAAEIQTIHRLGVLLGEEPGAMLSELTRAKPLPTVPPAVPIGLPGDLLKRRPDIREAEARVAAETARVGVARADLFPKILLTGAAGRQATEPSALTLGGGNFFSIGPAITLPIFTAGKIRGNIEAQKQRLDQALAEYKNTALRSLEESENALVAYGHEKDRQERLVAAVDASRPATMLANELYTCGLSDFLSVLDAQRQQLAAEDDLAQSNTVVVTNLVALYKALGGGWEAIPQQP